MDTETMKLVSARVTDFGCFCDSGDVPIDDVTALIAENENGKTTFLRALAWWSSSDLEFDEEDRRDGADPGTLDLVALTLDVSASAKAAFREVGVASPSKVRVVRTTTGEYRVEDPASGELLEPSVGPTRFEVAKDALVERLRAYAQVEAAIGDRLEAAQSGDGVAEATIAQIRESVLPQLPPEDQQVLQDAAAQLESTFANPSEQVTPRLAIDVIRPFLPALIYFDERIDFVRDSVTYAEVSASPNDHRTMINLAKAAGDDLVKIAGESSHARQRRSHNAQRALSTEFSKYWQGEPVTIYVQFDESQMTLTIEHLGRTQRPSRRSSGLKWQLGFFVNFVAEVKESLYGAVLLLDEPGLHLHIKQQPKLLELFDELAHDGCRIIYTTHLSHMLSPDKPHSFRPLVPDPKTPGATKVVPNIMALPSKSDVMQPVRQVLGMGIADAIGLGGRNVIAEGWAERYVLLAMNDFCRDAQRAALSPTATVLPAGGSGKKMLPLAAMAVAEKTHAVVLVDDDKAGRNTIVLLERALPGGVPSVRTHDESQQTNRELEDLFNPEYFLDLVNTSHAEIDGYQPISLSQIDVNKPICDAVEEVFKAKGLGKFQKLRPAMELQKRRELEEAPDDQTLDRFASLFERLDKALAGT